jgi:hypothetical protein
VQALQVGGERRADFRNAEVVRVEGFTGGDRIHAGLADELRRRLVGLAHPERQDVAAPEPGVEQLADLRGGQRTHGGAGGEHSF